MTDSDVITFVATQGYISSQIGRALTHTPLPTRRGLLATAPAFERPLPTQPRTPPSASFLDIIENDAAMAASMVLGFDVNDLLNFNPYQWTGSMSDLYNPAAGSIDLQSIANREAANAWTVSNIQDPLGFESLFDGAIEGGYTTPCGKQGALPENNRKLTLLVPDDEGVSYM